jgi:tetratricopeptide (TPR) repeat protein
MIDLGKVCEQQLRSSCRWVALFAAMASLPTAHFAVAADLAEVRAAFYRGAYEECADLARAEVEKGIWNDAWSRQLIQALLTTGRYSEAVEVYDSVAGRFSNSIPLRLLGAKALRYSGQSDLGDKLLDEIPELWQASPWRFSDRDNLIALGEYYLGEGEDARAVLEVFFDRVLKADSKFVDGHLAIARLALDKADYQEAVKSLKVAVELRPEDPQIHYLLAKAWAPSDAAQAEEHLTTALELNARHPDSILMRARQLIDAEDYDAGGLLLDEVFSINPTHPLAWAYKAAIAHLQGNYQLEGECRKTALSTWELNPEVDYLIGETLSLHYRFAEGLKYQRRSLRMDPNYMPARFQLAQDLLRTGEDDEGWSIVDQVATADKYNVVAFNLKTLENRISKFTTLEVPGFIIRMDTSEAKIYGPRVVALLQEAKRVLSQKYQFELTQPVTVEIFTQQSDFAIRTFGLPGGAGFLGVCFGSLITANSPASQGESPSNWESVLWHEFCHVITLQKTNNRMPRWLSEGISVYEELQRDPSWGQSMTPLYKTMLLSDDFVPLSELSGAFLNPKSPIHLQFAYFESSLAVRYLIETHGMGLMQKLLVDLGMGIPIDVAFADRYGDTDALDQDFQRFVHDLAESFLPEVDFGREGLPPRASPADLEQWLVDHPQSYVARRQIVENLMSQQKWSEALDAAHELQKLYPQDSDPGGALDLLSTIARELSDSRLELETLQQLADLSCDNVPALLRLIALCKESEQWELLALYSQKLLSVQPLIPTGHEGLVTAAKQLQRPELAIESLQALQEMQPLDPAGIHFELAEMLTATKRIEQARIEVLLALEHSPRYRDAQKLLVKIRQRIDSPPAKQWPIAQPDAGTPPAPPASTAIES